MGKKLTLGIACPLVFIGAVIILLRFMPGPRQPTDYVVIGTVATLVCILLAFMVFLSGSRKRSQLFYKRKQRTPAAKFQGR
jgi:multisubunit Na+/H+ antiporter MnhF subunit